MMWWSSGGGWGPNRERTDRKFRRRLYQPIEQAEDTRITPDMSPVEVELRIWRRIERMQAQRNSFIANLIGYIVVNIILWSIYAASYQDSGVLILFWGIPWPAFVTIYWGFSLARRGYNLFQNTPERVARREIRLRKEVEQFKTRMGYDDIGNEYSEKPKNDEKPKNSQYVSAVRLSTDGELIPDEIENADESPAIHNRVQFDSRD